MNSITIYKTGFFESAHILQGHPKCGKLHGHSYKYEVWITIRNEEGDAGLLEPHGFVLDFHEVKEYFNQFDHSDKIIDISCEALTSNASIYFDEVIKKHFDLYQIKIRIWETATSYAEVIEDRLKYE